MSRRKQSNPKPLKRKTDDTLEEVADLLHLPTDLFSLRDPEDDVIEYTLFTKRKLRRGVHFGPYRGHVTTEVEKKNDSLHVIEMKDAKSDSALFSITDDSGGWLKLLRPTFTPNEQCNATLFHNESSIWCTITSDIESDSEILVSHQWAGDEIEPPLKSSEDREAYSHSMSHLLHRRVKRRRPTFKEDATSEKDAFRDEDSDSVRSLEVSRRSPLDEKERVHNGSVSNDSVIKYEAKSPASSISSSASPTTAKTFKQELEQNGTKEGNPRVPYLNGCSCPPAFPYGGLTLDSVTESEYKCDVCDISFNSLRVLEVHQSFYCQGKIFGVAVSSDTDTEDNASNSKTVSFKNESPAELDSKADNTASENKKVASQASLMTSGDSAMIPKRKRTITQNETPSVTNRPTRVFKCPYCNYSSDKKASLTRHVRMHGTSPNADGHCDLPIATPPMARYCANCDIQFASYKNYHVHKEFYCNTRHVHKSMASSSSPTTVQQSSQSQPEQHHQTSSTTTRSPNNTPPTSESNSKGGYNMVLNQPLYAAISTSPLILVPCSYVAGGGLSPAAGLIPAGNIIIPNPSTTPEVGGSDSQGANVIPTYTVMPGASAVSPEPLTLPAPSPTSTEEAGREDVKITKDKVVPLKQENYKTKQDTAKDDTEKPLDLSFRKRDDDCPKAGTSKSTSESGSRSSNSMLSSSSASSSSEESCGGGQSLSVLKLVNPDLNHVSRSQHSSLDSSAVLAPPPVMVKQGTSRCKECNIVFYKHENYLVHKNRYCASRLQPTNQDPLSPDSGKTDGLDSPDRDEIVCRAVHKSPVSSPRVSNSRTPPPDASDSRETSPSHIPPTPAMLQYYCMACGIKYTSIDNLRAHQLYYCPKRDMSVTPPVALVPTYNRINQDFKCTKCKNAYPTEELLRQHPCVVQRKCPYCDVYCPTLSAAQRHLVTHTGIKSFRCSLCGYKGHTLRGMRTHIRIHLDKNSTTPEEAYILCMDEGGTEIGCANRKPSSGHHSSSDRIKSVIATEPPHAEASLAISPISSGVLPSDVVAIKAINDDAVATGDTTHWCQICGYSSSYKGNVVRHVKLVHKDLMSSQTISNIVNSRPTVETGHKHGDMIENSSRVPLQDSIGSAGGAEHSNSSSSLDVKPVINGSVKIEHLRDDEKVLTMKTETVSPPPNLASDSITSPKGIKRPLSEEGQCPTTFASKSGPKYCKSCDISFNYLSNFLAHKKFYCTIRPGDITGQDSNTVQSVQ